MGLTTSYPLDEPHLRVLRSVCELCAQVTDVPLYLRGMVERAGEPLRAACVALSTPSASAQLVRDLLGACGVDIVKTWDHDMRMGGGGCWVMVDIAKESVLYAVPLAHIPALILVLLDALAKTESRKEAALKALREARR